MEEDNSCCDNALFEVQLLGETMYPYQENECPNH